MTTSSWATFSGRTQPSRSGKVIPLSWSSTTSGSPADGSDADGGGGSGADVVDVAAVRVPGSRPSPPRSTAPVTTAATSTAPAVVRAIALARPVPSADGAGGTAGAPGVRRCPVQDVPSHQR